LLNILLISFDLITLNQPPSLYHMDFLYGNKIFSEHLFDNGKIQQVLLAQGLPVRYPGPNLPFN